MGVASRQSVPATGSRHRPDTWLFRPRAAGSQPVSLVVKRAGSTEAQKVRDALAATKSYPGVTGNITIDEKRNASKPAVVLKVEGGQFKYVTSINP